MSFILCLFFENTDCTRDTWFWLSASDIGKYPGQFHWADATKVEVDASMWGNGHPNEFGRGKETCIDLKIGDGKLYDNNCNTTSRVLCEVPPELAVCN